MSKPRKQAEAPQFDAILKRMLETRPERKVKKKQASKPAKT